MSYVDYKLDSLATIKKHLEQITASNGVICII